MEDLLARAVGDRVSPAAGALPAVVRAAARRRRRTRAGGASVQLESMREVGDWSWQRNPFVGTRPYQGLLVVLMMFNSSDLKDSNNSVYEMVPPRGAPRWYVVRDVGSALGETAKLDAVRAIPICSIVSASSRASATAWWSSTITDGIRSCSPNGSRRTMCGGPVSIWRSCPTRSGGTRFAPADSMRPWPIGLSPG